ncbi:hypothetical protein [Apilactobacillus micheneri]|nr:hypothetical protein [Apilactobacillus micheneri]
MSDKTMQKNIINKLPAIFNSEDDSNNQKILQIMGQQFNYNKNNLINDHNATKLSNARGQNLTDLATDYGITRVDDDDDFLKFQIDWQQLKANTPPTMNGLKLLISKLLNIDLQDFDILPTDNPKEIKIVGIPFDFNSGKHTSLKRKILNDSIQSILSAEYKLDNIEYSKSSNGNLFYGMIGRHEVVKKSKLVQLLPFNQSNSSYSDSYVGLTSQKVKFKKSNISNLDL